MIRATGVNFCSRFRGLAVFTMIIVGMLGCKPDEQAVKEAAIREANQRAGEWRAELHEHYLTYISGDYAQAKSSLEQMVKVTESAQIDPAVAAHDLYVTYSRLYLLEKRCGHNAAAQACMIKLRYWRLRVAELNDKTTDEAMAVTDKTTSDNKVAEIIDRWDADLTGGKGPAYKAALTTPPGSTHD